VKGLRIAGITAGVPHVARSVSCHAVQQTKKGFFQMSATAPPSTAASFPSLAKKVWIFAIIRGVLAIIFGLIALLAPIATAVVLAVVIGAYAIVDGVFHIIEAIRHRGSSSMVLRIVLGAVSILFGILVLVWPGISLAILVILVAIWAIIIGVLQIMSSVRHRAVPNSGWVWGIIGGALSILFGILVLIRPGAGLVSIIWIIGIWAIVWGITLIVLGVQLRKAATTNEAGASPTA
jgi:uncharacterized membrane protein HdeD (DUF308 family)